MKAFPQAIKESVFEHGMDLRDYFAAKAMQTILEGYIPEFHEFVVEYTSKRSYLMADAMMKEREKK